MFDFLNIKKLTTKINQYGYKYSFVDFFKSFILFAVPIFILAYLHHLHPIYNVILVATFFIMLPFVILSQYYLMNEQRRFQSLCGYLKLMIINFKQYKKVLRALKETREMLPNKDKHMLTCIDKAIQAIEDGHDIETAFYYIEKDYYNSYVKKLHSYLILGEHEGGDIIYEALNNVDFEEWQTDTYVFEMNKENTKKNSGLFTALSLGMSLFVIQNIPNELIGTAYTNSSYQMMTFLYFEIILIAYVSIRAFLTSPWIRRDE